MSRWIMDNICLAMKCVWLWQAWNRALCVVVARLVIVISCKLGGVVYLSNADARALLGVVWERWHVSRRGLMEKTRPLATSRRTSERV